MTLETTRDQHIGAHLYRVELPRPESLIQGRFSLQNELSYRLLRGLGLGRPWESSSK